MTRLLVASTGGHLTQLKQLAPRLRPVDDVLWVTFDTPQSRSLLEGEQVLYLDYIAPRDVRALAAGIRRVAGRLRRLPVASAVSTGSGIALAVLPWARLRGASCHYIESAARSHGPSLTGRLLGRVPGVLTYSQYQAWSSERWPFAGSVFDGFQPVLAEPAPGPKRVLVTLGTIPFQFTRLLERLAEVIPSDWTVDWQVGTATAPPPLPGRVHEVLPAETMVSLSREADVVVSHAGVGSALMALGTGRAPVLVPREARHKEHIDDHQHQVASELADRGLATELSVEEITLAVLQEAAARGVVETTDVPPVFLRGVG